MIGAQGAGNVVCAVVFVVAVVAMLNGCQIPGHLSEGNAGGCKECCVRC